MFLVIIILILFFSCYIDSRASLRSYIRYFPPEDEKSNLRKTTGIITDMYDHTTIRPRVIEHHSYKIEYTVNDITYSKMVFLRGNPLLLIPGRDIKLVYVENRPEEAYLDLTIKDLIKREIVMMLIFILLLSLIIGIIIIYKN